MKNSQKNRRRKPVARKRMLRLMIVVLIVVLLAGLLIIKRLYFPKSVTFEKTSYSMFVGETKVISAKTKPKLPFGNNLNYSSSNPKIASVSQNGTITAKSQGVVDIIATHSINKKKAILKLTVESNTIIIDLPQTNIKILKGDTFDIDAKITQVGNAEANIKYLSENENVATVSEDGIITGVNGGKTTVKIYDEKTQVSEEISVEIITQLESLTFSSDAANIEIGESYTPKIVFSPEDTTDKEYTLSIHPQNIAEIKDGKIVGISSGSATLSATHTATKKVATMKINVGSKVEKIQLSFVSTEIKQGSSSYITASITPADALDKTLNWTTTDASIATVWSSGDNTATIKGVSAGTCKIRATSKSNPDVYAEATIKVTKSSSDEVTSETYIDGVLIVNKTYGLPRSFNNSGTLTAETQSAFNKMKAAADAEGIKLWIASGYRSYDRQKYLFENYLNRPNNSQEDVETYSARPGFSEHQTGMALDVNNPSDAFLGTDAQKWLNEHCTEYGFIIRYPKGKENKTGYKYEPWHIRYLGVNTAQAVSASGLCLEEYLGITSVYADINYKY